MAKGDPKLISIQRLGLADLEWTADKLLKGAGAGADPTEIDVPGATQQFFVPCFFGVGGALSVHETIYSVYKIDTATEYAVFSFRIPNDFTSLTSVKVIIIPSGTGDFDWTASTNFGANGEDSQVHTDSTTADAQAATDDQLLELDISAAFTGLAADDIVGVKFLLDALNTTTQLNIVGLDVKYS